MWHAVDWLDSRARLTPRRLAVVDLSADLRLTYEQLNHRTCRLAAFLQRCGVSKGDRIALLAFNSVAYLELLFAARKIGAVFVPLNYRLSPRELGCILEDCTPRVLVYDGHHRSEAEGLAEQGPVPVTLDESRYEAAVLEESGNLTRVSVEIEDPWTIMYTGGTTGAPKGVVLSHRAILGNAVNTVISWGLTEDDVTPVYLPMFHTGGLNALTTPVLYAGGRVIIDREFDPGAAVRTLERENCTIALFVPTMYYLMIQTPEFARASFSSMKAFVSGAAPCPLGIYGALWDKGLSFKEGYGLTEAGPNNFYIHPREARSRIGSVGVPMFHNAIRLVDDRGQDVPRGETGEIWISGPHLFSGYWMKPDLTAEAMVDGWLRTGDLARSDDDGYFYIVGRKKDMIITGGENVYPLEAEQVLQSHPEVDVAVVVGVPDPKWGEIVAAAVVAARESALTADELKTYCRGRLAGYKIPKLIVFTGELPKTSVGKIDKKKVAAEVARSHPVE